VRLADVAQARAEYEERRTRAQKLRQARQELQAVEQPGWDEFRRLRGVLREIKEAIRGEE
jgi:uncharacterized protein YlxW (UPF0749 family)